MTDIVNHPSHYGGEDDPYEAIKVIEAWELGFNLGNTVKYVSRAGKKGSRLEDLKKAVWYLQREIGNIEAQHNDKQQLFAELWGGGTRGSGTAGGGGGGGGGDGDRDEHGGQVHGDPLIPHHAYRHDPSDAWREREETDV